MKRAIALGVALTFVAGCSGGGINGGSLLPGTSSSARMPVVVTDDGRHGMLDVNVTMRIPKRQRREHLAVHPATISPLTRSVSFVINGGIAQVFNTTTSSTNCKAGASGTVCTFAVKAAPGLDTFVVTTYNAAGGAGTALDRATAKVNIVAGKVNAPSIRLGPVVSIAADTGVGSLRYAIGSANPGDTIMFTIPATSKITLASPLTLSNNVSIAGPGVTTAAVPHRDRRHPDLHGNVTVTGLQISGGAAQQIFVIKGGVTSTISGLVLTDGLATTYNQPGGAVYNAGNATLSGDAFTDNDSHADSAYVRIFHRKERPRHKHAHGHPKLPNGLHPHCATGDYYGGAVYNHGNMTVSGSTFASNVLDNTFGCGYTYGGAIYTDEYGTLTSSGNKYDNNSAYYGGAVYVNASYGQATFTGDTFTANTGCGPSTGCALSGCSTPTLVCTTYPYGDGAAIYDGGGPGITVTGSTFTNNVAGGVYGSSAGKGGAIDLEAGSPVITASTFSGNLAGGGTANCSNGEGGAIYEDVGSSTIELDNDIFTSNKALGDDSSYGGAVYNDADPDSGSGNTFTSNQAYSTGGACNASTDAAGGALYSEYGIVMSNSKFTSNFAKSSGDSWGGAFTTDDNSVLTGDTFTSNSAIATGLHGSTEAQTYGGAIYATTSLRLTSCTFTSNAAVSQGTVGLYAQGGAVYNDDTFTSLGNTFTSNSVSIPTGTSTGMEAYGGAVYNAGGTYISNNDKYTSNSASGKTQVEGGGLLVDNTFAISNASFTSNKVTATGGDAYGGGLTLESSGTLSGSTFTGNSSSSTGYTYPYDHGGGGIYDDGSTTTLNGVTVTNNTVSGGSGGGIFAQSTESLNNSKISGNTASSTGDYGGGGGIYNDATLYVSNTAISANTASVHGTGAGGGGIYWNDTGTISGSTISGNKMLGTGTDAGGGGVFNYDGVTYTNDTISNNTSAVNGGGYLNYGAYSSYLQNVTLFQNTASAKGGNLYNDNGSTPYLTLANTAIGGGTAAAASGPDVYNSGTLTSGEYNIVGTAAAGGGTFTPATGDKVANPNLLALANNGGPTFTNADQSTSPGKAYIPWTSASSGTCGTVTDMSNDQRGYTRGAAGKCDVGAYELSGAPPAIVRAPHHPLVHPDTSKQQKHHRFVKVVPPQER